MIDGNLTALSKAWAMTVIATILLAVALATVAGTATPLFT